MAVAAGASLSTMLLSGWAVASSSGGTVPTRESATCGYAQTEAEDASTKELRKAVRCLANKARAQHEADRVRRDRYLQKAAQRHARVMSARDCLDSRCPGEPALQERIRRAGYLGDARRWGYAENTGCAVSADAMVETWLESSVHRANLLEPKFRDIGVGIVDEGPESRCDPGLAVFSAVLAWRKPGR